MYISQRLKLHWFYGKVNRWIVYRGLYLRGSVIGVYVCIQYPVPFYL